MVCFPLWGLLLVYLITFGWVWIKGHSVPPDFAEGPILFGYYFIPSVFGIVYLLVTAGVLMSCWWRFSAFSKLWLMTLVLYTIVFLIYVSYVAWWYLTGQKWGYL